MTNTLKMTQEEILTLLAAPFSSGQLSWRVGQKNKDKTKAMMLVYIDARDVMDRLDEVCGINWKDDYKEVQGRIVCNLQVFNTVRTDGAGDTDFEGEKGGISDAFKRSAVKFGIGRYLYNAKNFNTWLNINGHSDFDLPKMAKEQFADIARRLGENVQTYHFWLDKIDACQSLDELENIRTLATTYYKREQWSTGNAETFKKHIEAKRAELKDVTPIAAE